MKNRRPNAVGASAFKGVVKLRNGKFRAKINCDGTRFELGVYESERDAAIAYNAAAKVLHGEFAYPNEIPAAAAWNTRPATPAAPAKAVRVKPLEWDDVQADSIFGVYDFGRIGGIWTLRLNGTDIETGVARDFHAAAGDAKAAAQADYEARILSAIELGDSDD